MKQKKLFAAIFTAFLVVIGLLSATSCNHDDNLKNEQYNIIDPIDPADKPAIEPITAPAALIGNFGSEQQNLESCFTNIVSPQNASIIVIESNAVKANEEILSLAYQKGSLIAVFNAEESLMSDWCERNNTFYAGPEKDETCAVYGFNNKGTYYIQQATDDIGDDEVPMFYFCLWANSVLNKRYQGVDLRSQDIKKRFMPQSVTHTFNVSLDKKAITDAHWGDPDQLSLTTTANVTYTIYPFHVFDGNAQGDYYAVEAELTLYNAPLNNGKWMRTYGKEQTEICGFYLNRCDISAALMQKSGGNFIESYSHKFADGATPRPASTPDAATYNPGFEWGIQAPVSGGIPDSKDNYKMTTVAKWTWNNSTSASLPGITVRNSDLNTNAGYSLIVNGLPGSTDNLEVTPIPDFAKGELKFKYSWIWHVSNVDENSKERLYMQTDLNPIYQAYKWVSGGKMTIGEFENSIPQSKSAFRFPLTPPNRVATGSAIIRNSSSGSYYISDIKLWRNKSTDLEPDVIVPQTICTSGAVGGSGVNATMLILPAGEYIIKGIRYSMQDDKRVDEHVITNTQPIKVSVAGNITIDFGSDVFKVQ